MFFCFVFVDNAISKSLMEKRTVSSAVFENATRHPFASDREFDALYQEYLFMALTSTSGWTYHSSIRAFINKYG